MNILFLCNRSSRFRVLGSGFSVRGSRSSKMVRDCLGIASGPVRVRVDYVSITSRLRLVYVFDPYQAGKNGCGSAEYGTAKIRGFGEPFPRKPRRNLEPISNHSRGRKIESTLHVPMYEGNYVRFTADLGKWCQKWADGLAYSCKMLAFSYMPLHI